MCVPVTRRYCIKTAKRRITQTTPRDSHRDSSFLTPTIVGTRRPIPPEICAQWNPTPFEHTDFDQYPLIAPQPRQLAKKVQWATDRNLESRPRAFQRATDGPCTLPLSPSKGSSSTKRDFAVFDSKIQLLSKEVCYKVSLFENFHRQSCSFVYLTVHWLLRARFPLT